MTIDNLIRYYRWKRKLQRIETLTQVLILICAVLFIHHIVFGG